ncbi:MAG: SusD/RagB family nutrient-binding outer membrane lipoprotein [Arachidicoccus sp.]|nr:SusD/RagB family nutrient-binding outer membrane lipoprotein [Arachidicoccus sp.]
MNEDPTKSSSLDPSYLLSYVQLRYSGDLTINERTTIIMTMPLVQQIGGAYYNRYGFEYVYDRPYMSELWEIGYPDDVLSIVDAISRTTGDSEKTNLNAICRIMKVYVFSRITDLYGDIPYSEAGDGYINGTVKPKFDSQESIYDNFFAELDSAVAELNPSKDAVTQDLYYNGNVTEWKKFANSLHLRLAMRLSKVDPDKAQTEVMKAYNAGLFTSNSDICLMKHQNVQTTYSTEIRGNAVSAAINQYPDDGRPRICNTLINEMKSTLDPRLQYIARAYWAVNSADALSARVDITDSITSRIGVIGIDPGHYVYDDYLNPININIPGYGMTAVPSNSQKVQLADWLITNDAPYLHLTYAEVEFLLAEAAMRWNLNFGADAQTLYHNGMAAACRQLSLFNGGPVISDAQIQSFQNSNPLTPGKELQQIDTQLWVTLLLNGPEAYANWRRTGFPQLTPAITTESQTDTIPRRFVYPLSETEQNAQNLAEAVKTLGGTDSWTARVWWDKQ